MHVDFRDWLYILPLTILYKEKLILYQSFNLLIIAIIN